MSLRPPSLQSNYDDFFSEDPALIPQPEQPLPDAGPEAKAAYVKAVDEYLTKIQVARDTGDWGAITLEGQTPAKFVMRPMPGTLYRTLVDARERAVNPIGHAMFHQIAFRGTIVKVVDGTLGDEASFKLTRDPEFGLIANQSIADLMDRISVRIITELGGEALRRIALRPKS